MAARMMSLRHRVASAFAGATVFGSALSFSRAPLDTDDSTLKTLDDLYAGLDNGDFIPFEDQKRIDDSGGDQAYGELTIRGMRELQPKLRPRADDVFYDLGSGTGRAVVQAALEWPVQRAVGVELSASRHAVGEAAMARADPSLQKRVVLREGDMIACDGCEDMTILYVAGLLFDEPFMARLGERLGQLPRLRAITTLQRFPPDSLPESFVEDPSNAAPHDDAAARSERVEVTWGAARVYRYERAIG